MFHVVLYTQVNYPTNSRTLPVVEGHDLEQAQHGSRHGAPIVMQHPDLPVVGGVVPGLRYSRGTYFMVETTFYDLPSHFLTQ